MVVCDWSSDVCSSDLPIPCNPVNCSPPGSSVHGILQTRRLEWVAISSSRGSSQPRDQTHVSPVSCIGRWVLYLLGPPGKPSSFSNSAPRMLSCFSHVRLCANHGLEPARLLCSWDSPGKNTGVSCHIFLQGVFLTQGWIPCLLHLLHWQMDSSPAGSGSNTHH